MAVHQPRHEISLVPVDRGAFVRYFRLSRRYDLRNPVAANRKRLRFRSRLLHTPISCHSCALAGTYAPPAVELPNTAFFARSHYLKVRDRAAFAFALASVAVALEVKDGKIGAARVALGGLATKPWRAVEAEKVLVGAPAEKATFVRAARAALHRARPQKFNAFKIELAQRVIVRALTTVAEMG